MHGFVGRAAAGGLFGLENVQGTLLGTAVTPDTVTAAVGETSGLDPVGRMDLADTIDIATATLDTFNGRTLHKPETDVIQRGENGGNGTQYLAEKAGAENTYEKDKDKNTELADGFGGQVGPVRQELAGQGNL